jgi:hypothetical protein
MAMRSACRFLCILWSWVGACLPGASLLLYCDATCFADSQDPKMQTSFQVKYVIEGAVYIDGGSNAGLVEGQKLIVRQREVSKSPNGAVEEDVAELEVVSVASSSAVCEIRSTKVEIKPGDVVSLSPSDLDKLQASAASKDARKYPQIISFSEANPLEQEAREHVPRPPLPEINRIRGRIGLEYNNISNLDGSGSSTQYGVVLRADMTRIGGTYWNLSGFHRGRLNSRSMGSQQVTLNDLINRTYHLVLSYDNPGSPWVMGIGRFYLPWASSLDTIDGGYFGRHMGRFTVGLFGGSAPDPTSWRYSPNRELAGTFVNYEGGSFESFRHTSTFGIALNRVNWHPDRQFGFFENNFSYQRYLSVYHNLEVDLLPNSSTSASAPSPGSPGTAGSGRLTLSRSFLTVRFQPYKFLSFDFSDNYFRNIPSFDTRLLSTGLLDKYLFQGISGGVRAELPYHFSVYTSLGRSSNTGDPKPSLNEMFGVGLSQIWRTGIRADFRYSKFDSSFGKGVYQSLNLSRNMSEKLGFDIQLGQQTLDSSFTSVSRARFINSNLNWSLSKHYFLGLGATAYRGHIQSYNQWFFNFGYRFSSR